MEIGYKECTKCKKIKAITDFYKDKNNKDGLEYRCKQCKKEYEFANKERIYQRQKKYRKEKQNWKNEKTKLYFHNYYVNNEVNRFKKSIRRNLRDAFNFKKYRKKHTFNKYLTYSLEKIVGLNIKDFLNYLEQSFIKIYGRKRKENEKVQIDHIKPLATAKTIQEVIKLCNYKNLQLLLEKDNQRKGENYGKK